MKKLIQYFFLIGLPVVIAAYGVEFWLWHQSDGRLQETAKRFGVTYDARSKIDVVRALRHDGKRAHLYVPPETLFRKQGAGFVPALKSADGNTYLQPLGSVSKSQNVVCNESGAWFQFKTDRHGFNNPDVVWDRDRVDVLALGDSFTLGNCVPQGKGMVDRIRKEYPATLNLGAGGNGPLIQLAALREYGAKYRPKIVLWFFYPNDLQNLSREEIHVVLDSYRTNLKFSQSLITRQKEIDAGLSGLVDAVLAGAESRENKGLRIARFQKLRHLFSSVSPPPGTGLDDRYQSILGQAAKIVKQWGGTPVFVYLPQPVRWHVSESRLIQDTDTMRGWLLPYARSQGFHVVDLLPLFDATSDPKKLAYGPATHYSEAGYQAVADATLPVIRSSLAKRVSP